MNKVLDNSVIVVGAGRSGTTMLKNAFSVHPELFGPQYELNYLWRYGNSMLDHDMLDPNLHFSAKKGKHIRYKLASLLTQNPKKRLVEKTAANVLRLRYVHCVLPQARIIHIIRDGRAVVASAIQRWKYRPKASYLASKTLTIPLRDIPMVGFKYLINRLKTLSRGQNYLRSWGPRWPGIDNDVEHLPLHAVCAKQWVISIKSALEQKSAIQMGQYMEVRYEKVVSNPIKEFERMAEFIDVNPFDKIFQDYIRFQIRTTSIDRWKKRLRGKALEEVMGIIGKLQRELGYN